MDEAAAAIDGAASDLEDAGAPEGFADESERAHERLAPALRRPERGRDPTSGTRSSRPRRRLNFESWDKANLALAAMIGDGLDVKLIERQ